MENLIEKIIERFKERSKTRTDKIVLDTPLGYIEATNDIESFFRKEISVFEDQQMKQILKELFSAVNGAERITQLGVVEQSTKEGKAYYQGQYDLRNIILAHITQRLSEI